MKEKNYSQYEFIGQTIPEDVIDMLLKEKQEEIEAEIRKSKVGLYNHIYKYKSFSQANTYSFENFSNCTGNKNNPNSLSNYERIGYNDYRLVIPKLLMQALGTNVALYLAEIARLSMYQPVNDYGFYLYSKQKIKDDTGLTERQQDPICKKLKDWGVIDTVTFRKQQRKYYRFNDDFMVDLYWSLYRKTFARIKYRR